MQNIRLWFCPTRSTCPGHAPFEPSCPVDSSVLRWFRVFSRMATSTITSSVTFIPTGALQPAYTSPPALPALADTTPTQCQGSEMLLAAAGVSTALPVPAGWTAVRSALLVNTSLTGYALLTLNATSGAPSFVLAPQGGQFSYTHAGTVDEGAVGPTPTTWTLKSCDSAGVTANGVATAVFCYLSGV